MWKTGRYDFGRACVLLHARLHSLWLQKMLCGLFGGVCKKGFGLRWRDIGAGCEGFLGGAFLMVGFGVGGGRCWGWRRCRDRGEGREEGGGTM